MSAGLENFPANDFFGSFPSGPVSLLTVATDGGVSNTSNGQGGMLWSRVWQPLACEAVSCNI